MGLHLCYEISLPAHCGDDDLVRRIQALHQRALRLSFSEVSRIVRFDERAVAQRPKLRGLAFESLEHVVQLHAAFHRDVLYQESLGLTKDAAYEVIDQNTLSSRASADLPVTVIG